MYLPSCIKCAHSFQSYSPKKLFVWTARQHQKKKFGGPEIMHDPSMLQAKGILKFTRIKNEMDEGPQRTVRYGKCKQPGHNRATCAKRSSRDGGGSTGHGFAYDDTNFVAYTSASYCHSE
ncbi:unnamed protein product [Cuscuta epithymum]|uniref:Uncharacterized protein n=1 Tax=Cuscuta epithymum TaxID=186058 RepID=A0AAV0DSE6_9ASTE|nr:unnamed protein product [Cuscuta epithymum]